MPTTHGCSLPPAPATSAPTPTPAPSPVHGRLAVARREGRGAARAAKGKESKVDKGREKERRESLGGGERQGEGHREEGSGEEKARDGRERKTEKERGGRE